MSKNNNSSAKYLKALRRETKKQKRKYAPKGGTMAAQVKRAQASGFYVRPKRKPRIKIVHKTE